MGLSWPAAQENIPTTQGAARTDRSFTRGWGSEKQGVNSRHRENVTTVEEVSWSEKS